nr:4597_t:CDS:2 [Entrophospora candida]
MPNLHKSCLGCRGDRKVCKYDPNSGDERCKRCKLKDRPCDKNWTPKKRGRKIKRNNDTDDNHQLENLIDKDDFFKGDKSYIGYNNYAFDFDPSLPSDSDDPFSNNPIT